MLMWMRYCASFNSSNNMDNRLVLQLIQVEAPVFLGKIHSSTEQLIFKSGPSKPKLELISLCQWSMAKD